MPPLPRGRALAVCGHQAVRHRRPLGRCSGGHSTGTAAPSAPSSAARVPGTHCQGQGRPGHSLAAPLCSQGRRQPLDLQALEPGPQPGHPHHQEPAQRHPAPRELSQGGSPSAPRVGQRGRCAQDLGGWVPVDGVPGSQESPKAHPHPFHCPCQQGGAVTAGGGGRPGCT